MPRGRTLAEHLGDRGNLDADQRGVIEAMVSLHVKSCGGDVEKSLASIAAGPSTRERPTRLGDPELTATVSHLAADFESTLTARAILPRRYRVSTASGRRPAISRDAAARPQAWPAGAAGFVALDGELHREVAA